MVSKNLLKKRVEEEVAEVLGKSDQFCDCEQCQDDVSALALNHLKPRYAGSETGEVVLESTDISSTQTEMDIYRSILEAAKKVDKQPHHDR
ncbi:MAG: late competence development ComFB family protein [Bacillota bacterium]|jgi:competence protein ComFB